MADDDNSRPAVSAGPVGRRAAVHLVALVGVWLLLTTAMAYPFLAGRYDSLAFPVSTMAQVFGVVGLPLVPGGLGWLLAPRHGHAWAALALVVGTAVALAVALFAALGVGYLFGVLTLLVGLWALGRLRPALRATQGHAPRARHPAALYLVTLPALALASQWMLAGPLTEWSRDRAMASAAPLIADIERYREAHGRYPLSLTAQHADYTPGVVGIERYGYLARGESYNLSFEQPRFLLDRFGTREWVVYNPRNEHRMYSHAAWLLSPHEADPRAQGWYASGDAGQPHWMYFLFD